MSSDETETEALFGASKVTCRIRKFWIDNGISQVWHLCPHWCSPRTLPDVIHRSSWITLTSSTATKHLVACWKEAVHPCCTIGNRRQLASPVTRSLTFQGISTALVFNKKSLNHLSQKRPSCYPTCVDWIRLPLRLPIVINHLLDTGTFINGVYAYRCQLIGSSGLIVTLWMQDVVWFSLLHTCFHCSCLFPLPHACFLCRIPVSFVACLFPLLHACEKIRWTINNSNLKEKCSWSKCTLWGLYTLCACIAPQLLQKWSFLSLLVVQIHRLLEGVRRGWSRSCPKSFQFPVT